MREVDWETKQYAEGLQPEPANKRVSDKPVESKLLFAGSRLINSSGPFGIISLSAQFTFTTEVLLLLSLLGAISELLGYLLRAQHANAASQASVPSAAASELSQVD